MDDISINGFRDSGNHEKVDLRKHLSENHNIIFNNFFNQQPEQPEQPRQPNNRQRNLNVVWVPVNIQMGQHQRRFNMPIPNQLIQDIFHMFGNGNPRRN